jgi:hypothetical protein
MNDDAAIKADVAEVVESLAAMIIRLERRIAPLEAQLNALEKLAGLQAHGLNLLGNSNRNALELTWATIRLLHDLLSRPQDEALSAQVQRGLAEVRELERLFPDLSAGDPPKQS